MNKTLSSKNIALMIISEKFSMLYETKYIVLNERLRTTQLIENWIVNDKLCRQYIIIQKLAHILNPTRK